jgi:alkylation response protein AidB-like acyl-CoA dehydrogenase
LFALPEEHVELHTVLRDLCEREIAPHAADVDERRRFPDEALAALNAAGLSAVHIPEEYGGQGGDAVAGCIVIEEVARVCALSSMIPVANKLGTMGIVSQGSDDLRKQVFPSLASGEAMAAYGLSEREAASCFSKNDGCSVPFGQRLRVTGLPAMCGSMTSAIAT